MGESPAGGVRDRQSSWAWAWIIAAWVAGPVVWLLAFFAISSSLALLVPGQSVADFGATGFTGASVACALTSGAIAGRRLLVGGFPPLVLCNGLSGLMLWAVQHGYGALSSLWPLFPAIGLLAGVLTLHFLAAWRARPTARPHHSVRGDS